MQLSKSEKIHDKKRNVNLTKYSTTCQSRWVDGHAGLWRGPIQLVLPAGQQREPRRHDPPVPDQGQESR